MTFQKLLEHSRSFLKKSYNFLHRPSTNGRDHKISSAKPFQIQLPILSNQQCLTFLNNDQQYTVLLRNAQDLKSIEDLVSSMAGSNPGLGLFLLNNHNFIWLGSELQNGTTTHQGFRLQFHFFPSSSPYSVSYQFEKSVFTIASEPNVSLLHKWL